MSRDSKFGDWFFESKLVSVNTQSKTIDFIDLANGRGTYDKQNPYFIRFNQLDSVCAFLWWLRHMCEKDWFTTAHVEQFSKCYESIMRNEMVPQEIHGKQFETDADDLEDQ